MAAILDYRGKTPNKTDRGIPLITAKIIKGGWIEPPSEFIAPEDYDSWMTRGLPLPGDVVLTTEAPLGEVAQLGDEKVALAQRVITLRGKPGLLDNTYLKFALQTEFVRAQLLGRASGSTVTGIKQSELRRVELKIPPFNEQRSIANILGTLDDKIELNRRMNETLEAIARTMFKSWFVDFDPVRAKMSGEPPESICQRLGLTPDLLALFPDLLVDSELGEIPEEWEIRKIEKVLTRLSTKTRYTKDEVAPYGAVPVFEQGAGILLGYHNGTAQFSASANDPAFIFGDHTCVTHLACEPFDISQNVIPLKGTDRSSLWVFYAVRDKQVFQEYRRHWMELVAKDVVVPPEPFCNEFAKIVGTLHLDMEANVRQNRKLAEIRDALLPKLLSGELRAPDDARYTEMMEL